MSPTEINIAIAEAQGWKIEPSQAKGGWKLYCGKVATSFWFYGPQTPTLADVAHQLPDYCADLNAMSEALAELRRLNRPDYRGYVECLRKIVAIENSKMDADSMWEGDATARQRAEALLRTLGKWRDQ